MPNTEECMELIPKLAKKPSDLMRQAIHDLERAEADSRYSVSMWLWHDEFNGQCAVCLAGAVIAFSLGMEPNKCASPSTYSHDYIWSRLHALDDFRTGDIRLGLMMMGLVQLEERVKPERCKIALYESNPALFKADMLKLADTLETMGY